MVIVNPGAFATWVQDFGFPTAALIVTAYALGRVYADQRQAGDAHRAEAMKALGENTAAVHELIAGTRELVAKVDGLR